jgi:hypothetical protein
MSAEMHDILTLLAKLQAIDVTCDQSNAKQLSNREADYISKHINRRE